MLIEGNLLKFTPFYFPDGKSEPKPKFFIVLKTTGDNLVLGSLPTRHDSVPAFLDGNFGCVRMNTEDHGFDFCCYRISSEQPFLEDGTNPFHTSTHLYGETLKVLPTSYFDRYPFEGVDYHLIGKISPVLLADMISCFSTSPAVKKRITRLLS
jgi:hypothetical protein